MKIFILALLIFSNSLIFAQTAILNAEYHINMDKGAGNGMAMQVILDSKNNRIASIHSEELNIQTNDVLFLRLKNSKGVWSTPVILKLDNSAKRNQSKAISQAEFFVNNDKGFGNNNQMEISGTKNPHKLSCKVDLQNKNDVLYIRAKNTENMWGPATPLNIRNNFIVEARGINVTKGNLPFSFDIINKNNLGLSVTAISLGNFKKNFSIGDSIYIQMKNNQGFWGPYFKTIINDFVSSIAEKSSDKYQIKIFPNPSTDIIYISIIDNSINHSISIINSLGAEVKRIGANENLGKSSINISISDLPVGMYYCVLSNQNGSISKSFAVVR